MLNQDQPDYNRIFLAIFIATVLIIGWQIMVEWPRRQALSHMHTQTQQNLAAEKVQTAKSAPGKESASEENVYLSREERLKQAPRVSIASGTLSGSISLKGARFDDLSFTRYHETVEPDSPEVVLFSPNGDPGAYFAQAGWLAQDEKTKVPDNNTVWKASKSSLGANESVALEWNNGEGVTYRMNIALDDKYMFTLAQSVENKSGHAVTLLPYAYINRAYHIPEKTTYLHEGPLGVTDGALAEHRYMELKEKGNKVYEKAQGWLGISDHYWLAAFVPPGNSHRTSFSHYVQNKHDRFQSDYLDEPVTIENAATATYDLRLFAGAKELSTLDYYARGNTEKHADPIPLFDRALDFGSFYFLAKPMCIVTDFLFRLTGNFGVALLIFIIIVKALMFPLANKSYKSMAQMRRLQPEMIKIREKYFDDQMALHKATRELYKREKVNPAAGCLPVLIQVLVFIALFRGLNVTIEIRHAPFFGWIRDLSAADPSNIFNLFGLLDLQLPPFLHLGLLPILYCITMVIQTSQQPTPPDPVQAKMMKFMPYFLLLFFDKMASGFVLYWTWSNILSIFQQRYISKRYEHLKPGQQKAAAHG